MSSTNPFPEDDWNAHVGLRCGQCSSAVINKRVPATLCDVGLKLWSAATQAQPVSEAATKLTLTRGVELLERARMKRDLAHACLKASSSAMDNALAAAQDANGLEAEARELIAQYAGQAATERGAGVMSAFNHTTTLALDISRCWTCGIYWAIEKDRVGTCPRCASKKAEELAFRVGVAERSARSSKAAYRRLKASRKRTPPRQSLEISDCGDATCSIQGGCPMHLREQVRALKARKAGS